MQFARLTAMVLASIISCACNNSSDQDMQKSGIQMANVDNSIRPQDDLFGHVNGKWLASVAIPEDRPSWGSIDEVREHVLKQLNDIIEQASDSAPADSEARKVKDMYASAMNEARLEQLGLAPLAPQLDRIMAIASKSELSALVSELASAGTSTPLTMSVIQDARDSKSYVAAIQQSGLGLPDRDYYLQPAMASLVVSYTAHIRKQWEAAGLPDAQTAAASIVALETELAKVQWRQEDSRDADKTYNKLTLMQVAQLAPGIDWATYLESAKLKGKADLLLIAQPSYLQGLGALIENEPLDKWKLYLQWQSLRSAAPFLSKTFEAEDFAFYGTVLSGVTKAPPRWKSATEMTSSALGDGLGKLYVAKHFPASSKKHLEALVATLIKAYRTGLHSSDWMSTATRTQAQAKLDGVVVKIGYPAQWKDYSNLTISRDDLLGNVTRAQRLEYERGIAKLGREVDRQEWFMPPQTVNAYYNPTQNEIVFPAAILQPPFFDADADDAVNYGAIGAVIGHELSHGFDDQGSKYDAGGQLRNWWTDEDRAAFTQRTLVLVAQYGAFEPLPGHRINGQLTLGENIADNVGLGVAFEAYRLSLAGAVPPHLDGYTGEQRFYMGLAQVFKIKMRDEQQLQRLQTDPHSPGRFRVNGSVRNQNGFQDAFGLMPTDALYLAPTARFFMW